VNNKDKEGKLNRYGEETRQKSVGEEKFRMVVWTQT
jgi:hypothetical protein